LKSLVVPRDLYEHIIEDARRTPDVEICGLLGGRGSVCSAAYPVMNVSPDPATAFYMDPQTQINAMNAMRGSGETMLGIYHSHPRTEAKPSPRDVAGAAYPGVAYVIISLMNPDSAAVAAFDFVDGDFAPMRLSVGETGTETGAGRAR